MGLFKSYHSSILTIGIGNLSVGGTGKTPFTAYLIEELSKTNKKIAVISRGYGRISKGLILVDTKSSADQVGDEPLLLKQRYPNVLVWVAEKRIWAIKEAEKRDVDVILLDDNFQHRSVAVDIQFILSKFTNPFFKDYPMPRGRLREFRQGANRADYIIYTNSPDSYRDSESSFSQLTRKYSQAEIRFAHHQTMDPQWAQTPKKIKKVLAVSGIANPTGFLNACKSHWTSVTPLTYKDHKRYSTRDRQYMLQMLNKLGEEAALVCTEKDWVKLRVLFSSTEQEKYNMGFIPVVIRMDDPIDIIKLINSKKV